MNSTSASSPSPPAGLILLVEDDGQLRALLAQFLSNAGYQVIEAASATHALEFFHQHSAEICLLLTDVVMPGLFGDQLAVRLQELKPDLKVILMSGNAMETLCTPFPLVERENFLWKPFLLADLKSAVAGQLASLGSEASLRH